MGDGNFEFLTLREPKIPSDLGSFGVLDDLQLQVGWGVLDPKKATTAVQRVTTATTASVGDQVATVRELRSLIEQLRTKYESKSGVVFDYTRQKNLIGNHVLAVNNLESDRGKVSAELWERMADIERQGLIYDLAARVTDQSNAAVIRRVQGAAADVGEGFVDGVFSLGKVGLVLLAGLLVISLGGKR